MSMLLLAGCLVAGFAVGRFARLPEIARRLVGWGLSLCLFALVFLLGVKLGGDRNLLSQLGTIGTGALLMALGCTGGSIAAIGAYLGIKNTLKGKKN